MSYFTIDKSEHHKYAIVTYVIDDDKYVSSAIVLAHSIKITNSFVDLVVLITPEISNNAIEILNMFFDTVIKIDYLLAHVKDTTYLSNLFTKYYALNLTKYQKIILLHPNSIMLNNPDIFFSLKCPSGSLLNNKIECFCKIPKKITDNSYKNFDAYGIDCDLLVLEPNTNTYESIIKDLSSEKINKLMMENFVYPDQQYLSLKFSGEWNNIPSNFLKKYKITYPKTPYITNNNNFSKWYALFGDMMEKNPQLETSEIIRLAKNNLTINKSLSRHYNFSQNNNLTNIISNKFNVPKNKINKKNIKYYHIDNKKSFRPINYRNKMFDNVEKYNYFKPIRELATITKVNFYTDLAKKLPSIFIDGKYINEYNNFTESEKDLIISQYVKSRNNIFISIIWPIAINCFDKIVDKLKNDASIYYLKKINLSKLGLKNLMYALYDDFEKDSRLRFTKEKIDYVMATDNNTIGILIFENDKNKQISGQGAKYKQELRNVALTNIKNKLENTRSNDMLHINDFDYQAWEIIDMLCNKNSINFLENQNLDKFVTFDESFCKLNTFKNWIYSNLNQLERLDNIIMGGVLLYLYGFRELSDIDGIFTSVSLNNNTLDKIKTDFIDDNTKFNFIDAGVYGVDTLWRDKWTDLNNIVFRYAIDEKVTINDIIYNPLHHFNYCGLKFYLLDYEIYRKILKLHTEMHKPKQIAKDFTDIYNIYINSPILVKNLVQMNNGKLNIKNIFNNDVIFSFVKNKNDLIRHIVEYDKKKYKMNLQEKTIERLLE